MGLNKYEITIIAFIILVIFGVAYHTQPLTKPNPQKVFEAEIENAKKYYEEAKALSLSMPLLNDSALTLISDSIIVILVELNECWVIYVRTHEGFEEYTEDIQTLNKNLQTIKIEYEVEIGIRKLWRNLRRITPGIERRKSQQV